MRVPVPLVQLLLDVLPACRPLTPVHLDDLLLLLLRPVRGRLCVGPVLQGYAHVGLLLLLVVVVGRRVWNEGDRSKV